MISLFKVENNLIMLVGKQGYHFEICDTDLQVYDIRTDKAIIIIDVKDKYCLIRTEQGDKLYKSTKGIINELWRVYRG